MLKMTRIACFRTSGSINWVPWEAIQAEDILTANSHQLLEYNFGILLIVSLLVSVNTLF